MSQKLFKKIWDNFSDKLGTTILHPQYYAKKFAWEAVQMAANNSYGILLDIGCGRMPYKQFIIPKVKKYIGIDHPKTSKLYHGKEKPNIYADASSIPLPNKYANTILMLMVLEHIPQPHLVIQEAKRLLKTNGTFILSTVQFYPIHDAPHDFFRYTKFGLKELFINAGFKNIKIISQGGFFSFLAVNINVFLFKSIYQLLIDKKYFLFGLILLPFFYINCLLINILFYLPIYFENPDSSKFNVSHLVFAKQK